MEKKPNFSGPRRPQGSRPRPGQRPGQRGGRTDKDPYATNEQIRAREVRLVGDNVEQGIYPIEKARRIARDLELDLIEISPIAEPPDDHDYNFKLKHAQGFLKEGSKVKAYVFFRGRSILFKEQGEVLLLRFANDLEDLGKVEQMPVLEGKRMTIMITPLKNQSKKEAPKKEVAAKGNESSAEAPATETAEE